MGGGVRFIVKERIFGPGARQQAATRKSSPGRVALMLRCQQSGGSAPRRKRSSSLLQVHELTGASRV